MTDEYLRRLKAEREMEKNYRILRDIPVGLDHDIEAQKLPDAIGGGTTRQVFGSRENDQVVIKEMITPFPLPNFVEYFMGDHSGKQSGVTPSERCTAISRSGKFLSMERLIDLERADYALMPELPDFISDGKLSNFGKSLAGDIKVRDYALNKIDFALNLAAPNIGLRAGLIEFSRT